MSRRTIRTAFKNAIESVYSGRVFDTRLTDSRDMPEYVSIYMVSAVVENHASFSETRCEIVVEFSKLGADDNQLDVIADKIKDSIVSDSGIDTETTQLLYSGFEYETQESGHNSIKNKFIITY